MNRKEISKIVIEKKYSFLSVISTQWHAINLLIMLKRMGGYSGKILIVINKVNKEKLIEEKIFEDLELEIDFLTIDFEDYSIFYKLYYNIIYIPLILTSKKMDEYIYIAMPHATDIYFKKFFKYSRIKFIILDEGIGTYMYDNSNIWSSMNTSRKLVKFYFLKVISYLKKIYKRNIYYFLNKNGELIDNRIFLKKNNELLLNYEVISSYRNYFLKKIPNYKKYYRLYEDSIVINTQPLIEDNHVDKETYHLILESLLNNLKEYRNLKVLKPHPREKNVDIYKNLGYIVDINNLDSQESIISTLDNHPKIIIGIFSTTLISLNLFYGIKTVSLAKILLKYKISIKTRYILEEYIRLFQGIVIFPDNIEEIKYILY